MCGIDGFGFQGIAQSARHCFRIAEIAHERGPLHRRTEKIGACVADPFANGEGAEEIDTFTVPMGRRRRVYRPSCKVDARQHALSTPECCSKGNQVERPTARTAPSQEEKFS